jgi:hypothetical protein
MNAPGALSPLFLFDAEQLCAELAAAVASPRPSAAAAAVDAAQTLADLLRTMRLDGFAACARRLVQRLGPPSEPATAAAALALTQTLQQVIARLHDEPVSDDGTAFAEQWLAQHGQCAPAVLPAAAQRAAAAEAPAGDAPGDKAVAAPDWAALVAPDEARRAALDQARRLHRSLEHMPEGPGRTSVLQVIERLLVQTRVTVDWLPGLAVDGPALHACAESLIALADALQAMGATGSVRPATVADALAVFWPAGACGDEALAAAAARLAPAGGMVRAEAGGVLLALPIDADRPRVRVVDTVQGPLARYALQDGPFAVEVTLPPTSTAPVPPTAPGALRAVWRHPLPEPERWAPPAGWVALAEDASGDLMPLVASASVLRGRL